MSPKGRKASSSDITTLVAFALDSLEEPTSEVSTAVRFVAQKLTGQLAEGGSAVTEAAADKKRMKKQKKPKDPPDQNPKQQRKLFSRSA